jgi:hypothetical protein
MTIGHAPDLKVVKPGKYRLVLFSVISLCAGLFFLSRQIDWTQEFPDHKASLPAGQGPEPSPAASGAPGFDAVSADGAGMLVAAGRGPAGATIVLLNGTQKIGEVQADGNGEWVLMPGTPLDAGDYVLSLQAIDPETHRITPGARTFAFTIAPHGKTGIQTQILAAAPSEADRTASSHGAVKAGVTAVKRGDTLWDLARRHYGNAMRYPEIVEANKPQIKNPNLIYPNQQFEIPHK